jgi:predicted 3-demethylubiquinone-9 3-methyltransferase (glyoxalase superfamily)
MSGRTPGRQIARPSGSDIEEPAVIGQIIPDLWFDTRYGEAAASSCEVFGGRIATLTRHSEAGPREAGMVLTVELEIRGRRFIAINGGPSSPSTRPSRSG